MHREVRQRYSWSDLPPELVLIIAGNLKCDNNTLVNFRAVCKSWRSLIPPPYLQLHPFLPGTISSHYFDVTSHAPLLLVSAAVYIFRQRRFPSANPWLVAVEQSSYGKLRFFHPLTRLPLQNLPQKVPRILSHNHAIKLSQGCNLRLYDAITPALPLRILDRIKSYCVNKVIFWHNSESNSVMVLYSTGFLECFRLSCCDERQIKEGVHDLVVIRITKGADMGVDNLVDDIVTWKDMVWAVGRKGKLYGIDYECLKVQIVANATFDAPGCRRKRLLWDSADQLWLIVVPNQRCDEFYVYKLNSSYAWVKVETLFDQILFVTVDTCFFACSKLLPGFKGNCIVFPKNCFPSYFSGSKYSDDALFKEASGHLQVGVCKYGEGVNFELISAFPRLAALFWPPPQWFWNPHEKQKALLEDQQQSAADACSINDPKNANAGIEVLPPAQTITEQVEGTLSKADVIAILKKVWANYGNIVEGSALCVSDTKAVIFSLTSLAKVISILQNTSANTLTENQVQYLVSALANLQRMQLKVDWLVPFVEKAIVRYKCKPWLAALSNAAALKEDMLQSLDNRLKFVFHLQYIDDNQLLADLNKCLGEGLV